MVKVNNFRILLTFKQKPKPNLGVKILPSNLNTAEKFLFT